MTHAELRTLATDSEWTLAMVEHIMIQCGPDGHTDGADVIRDLIVALLTGDGIDRIAHLVPEANESLAGRRRSRALHKDPGQTT